MRYLTTAAETVIVTALDQNGRPFLGEVPNVSVSSDQPGVVNVSGGTFTNGTANLVLTQESEGTANITIVAGGISQTEQVSAYQPVLTSLQIGAAS